MSPRFSPIAIVTLLLTISACTIQVPAGLQAPAGKQSNKPAVPVTTAEKKPVITGVVTAPASVLAPQGLVAGGQVISAGGGNVISAGGGNYHVQAVSEQAVANAEVFLADGAGNPYPGLPSVRTDSKGKYVLPDVPADFTYVVVVKVKTKEGKDAFLKTLCHASALGTTADVTTATTLLTTGIAQSNGKMLGQFNPATFRQAADQIRNHLREDALPDLSNTQAIAAHVQKLASEVNEIKVAVDELKRDLAEIKASIDDLKAKIDELKRQPIPSPTPNAVPMPSPTPVAVASSTTTAPSPSPTTAASPVPSPSPSAAAAAKPRFMLKGKVTTDNGGGYPVKVRFAPRLDLDANGGAGGETTTDAQGNWAIELEAGTDNDARFEVFFTAAGGSEVSRGTFRLYMNEQVLSPYTIPGPAANTTPANGNPVFTLSGKVAITNSSGSYPVKVRFAPRFDLDSNGGPGGEVTTDASGNWTIELEVGSDRDARFEIFYTPAGGSEISRGTFRLYTDDQTLNAHNI